jgi:acetyl-CoA carboxylase biotin carboxyl carrier protein
MTDAETGGNAPDRELVESVWQEARDLIKRLEGSSVQRIRVDAGDTRIEIERGLPANVSAGAAAPSASVAPPAVEEEDSAAETDTRHPIVAPLVGTFYRAPQPGAKPFVEEGDVVDEGQPLAILEAMKLMNQVTADRGGRVVEIVAADGEWVEFEQVLMYLEPLED